MARVFISYVEEDHVAAFKLAEILESVGFNTWLYERDSVPGPSYLLQTGQAIKESQVFSVILSKHSLGSHQVGREIVRAHEENKPFVPLLHGIQHPEFQKRQPEWREAIGAATSIAVPIDGLEQIKERIVAGFKAVLSTGFMAPLEEQLVDSRSRHSSTTDHVKSYHRTTALRILSSRFPLVISGIVVILALFWGFLLRTKLNTAARPTVAKIESSVGNGSNQTITSDTNKTTETQQPLSTIAIFEFDDNTSDNTLHVWRKGLRDMLATDIAQDRRLQVVERSRLQELLTEHQLTKERFIDPATAVRLGKGLAAHWVVVGSFVVFGNDVRVDARVVSVEKGTVVAAESVRGPRQSILDLEKTLAVKLLMAVELNPEIPLLEALRRPHTANLQAFTLYSQAMEALDKGDVNAHRSLLEQSVNYDNQFGLAKQAITKIGQKN